MRLIDADEAKKQIKQMQALKPSERMLFRMALERTPTYDPLNDPLTLEELREMDGEPVWVDDVVFHRDRSCSGLWAIVVSAWDEIVFGDRDSMPLKDVVGFAYRRNPEEEAP